MRLTAETYQAIDEFRHDRFFKRGVELLISNYPKIVQERKLTSDTLRIAVKKSFIWVTEKGFSSPLLAMRMTCAQLCFGSFFMEDTRYAALRDILEEHIRTHEINDEDRIHDYIIAHQADWQNDWFSEHLPLTWKLCAARNIIPHTAPEWPTAGGLFQQLFDVERRSSFLLPENTRQGIFQQLMKSASVAVTTGGDEQVQLLLAIAQYYDGFRCFDDPLRPRWYGMLASENRPHLPWRLQELFTPGKQQDKHYEQSRSA